MRDDVTPMFKEVSTEPRHFERLADDVEDEDAEADRALDEVLDALRASSQDELFPELGRDLRGAIMAAARAQMPDWQYRAFTAWYRGTNRTRIARNVLGVSRSAVRSALDGEGHGGGAGAIEAFLARLRLDEPLKKMVMTVATKSIGKQEKRAGERILGWYRGIENRPDMVVPLALLMVLDELADARREVKIADVLAHFPRNLLSPCMRLLSAHGFAASNGHTVKIHRLPVGEP